MILRICDNGNEHVEYGGNFAGRPTSDVEESATLSDGVFGAALGEVEGHTGGGST